MKKLIFLLFLTPILHSLPVDAQFKSSGKQAEMVNIKFISQDETLNIAKIIGNLTSDQSERIYLANLQINRKILGRPEAKNVVDINDPLFLKYRKEKEIVYLGADPSAQRQPAGYTLLLTLHGKSKISWTLGLWGNFV